jgi:hypothetical protein
VPDTARNSFTAEEERRLRAQGYTPELQKGQRVFCRTETPTGSRVAREACLDPMALHENERAVDALSDRLHRDFAKPGVGTAGSH